MPGRQVCRGLAAGLVLGQRRLFGPKIHIRSSFFLSQLAMGRENEYRCPAGSCAGIHLPVQCW